MVTPSLVRNSGTAQLGFQGLINYWWGIVKSIMGIPLAVTAPGGRITAIQYLRPDGIYILGYPAEMTTNWINASGTAGQATLTVDNASIAGWFGTTAGKIGSLYTLNHEIVDITSTSGTTLYLARPLRYTTVRAQYLTFYETAYTATSQYPSFSTAWRIARILGTAASHSYDTNVVPEQNKIDVSDMGYKFPDVFWDQLITVNRTMTLRGVLASDTYRTARQYRNALYNIARCVKCQVWIKGWIYDSMYVQSVNIHERNDQALNTGQIPTAYPSEGRIKKEVQIQLTYAPGLS